MSRGLENRIVRLERSLRPTSFADWTDAELDRAIELLEKQQMEALDPTEVAELQRLEAKTPLSPGRR